MNVPGSLATASLFALAMSACAAPTAEDGSSQDEPVEEEPLDVTVDSLDIAHGALRLRATMVDGAADVSVQLAGTCEPRDVGGGLSTRSALVWSLGENDVAEAMDCGLRMRARVRDGTRFVNRVAELDVAVDVSAQEGENADDGPRLQSVTMSEPGVSVVFSQVTRGARLTTGDNILGATRPEPDEQAPSTGDTTGQFTVPRIDFARSVLGGRRLRLDGSQFTATLSVGGVPLQAEAQGQDETQGQDEQQGQGEQQEEEQDDTAPAIAVTILARTVPRVPVGP
jgi:hypothetical protein